MKTENNTVEFGVVVSFHRVKQSGIAMVEGIGEVYFSMARCRRIEPGQNFPEFTGVPNGEYPYVNTEIVLTMGNHERGLYPPAAIWGYKRFWDRALDAIRSRQVSASIPKLKPKEPALVIPLPEPNEWDMLVLADGGRNRGKKIPDWKRA